MTFKDKINAIVKLWNPHAAACYKIKHARFGVTSGKNYADLIPENQGIEHIYVEGDEQADVMLAALQQSSDWHYYELRDWKTLKTKVNRQ
jgi:hypothetical protein